MDVYDAFVSHIEVLYRHLSEETQNNLNSLYRYQTLKKHNKTHEPPNRKQECYQNYGALNFGHDKRQRLCVRAIGLHLG